VIEMEHDSIENAGRWYRGSPRELLTAKDAKKGREVR
jgi:hypothetical protein